jgi:hypothetical protein
MEPSYRLHRRPGPGHIVGLALALASSIVLSRAPAGADPVTGTALDGRTAWRVTVLPLPPGATAGDVRGTDGGDRWVGLAGSRPVLWRHGHVTVLGTGRAEDVNRRGIVVGADSPQYGTGHAVLWRGGRQVRLAEPPGFTASTANDINDTGLIVGSASTERRTVGLVWSTRSPGRVRILAYGDQSVALSGVSNRGLIVGGAWPSGSEESPRTALQGTLRTGLRALVPPGVDSFAGAVAGRHVVGGTPAGATVWRAGTRRVLFIKPGLIATDVNRFGTVSGFDTERYRPLVWNRDSVEHLPLLPGWDSAAAMAMNDRGQAGGVLTGPAEGLPVLWTRR